MIAFLLTIYTAVVVVLFKMKLIKPRPYPVVITIAVGVLLIGGVVVAWALSSPVTPRVVTAQYVIALVPYVKGQVKKVVAQANQPVKKGDLLLEINPEPYQFNVDNLASQFQGASDNVKQAQAALEAATAGVAKAKSGVNQAQAALDQAKAGVANAQAGLVKAKAADDLAITQESIAMNLQKTDAGAISALKVTEAVQNRQAADAAVKQAEAALTQSQAAQQQAAAGLSGAQSTQDQAEASDRQAASALEMAKAKVPSVQAQLNDAQFNLSQCKMLAPADGYVVDWTVQEGTMLVPMPFAAAGTFIATSETVIVASFPQNYLTNVEPGNDVEVVLNPYPGRLFKGKVDTVIPASGEGQFAPSGTIPMASRVGSQGLFAVKIRLIGQTPPLPLGAGGTVAIYTDKGKPVHIVSKVAIRMKKWLLYVMPA